MAATLAPPRTGETEHAETPSATELLELLGDEYTRRVYAAVAERARCGRDVAEAADVSRPTAYRRLNDLREAGLVRAEMAIDADGHHRERFEAVDGTLSLSLEDGRVEGTVSLAD